MEQDKQHKKTQINMFLYTTMYWSLITVTEIAIIGVIWLNKGNNKITELRAILQRESQNS